MRDDPSTGRAQGRKVPSGIVYESGIRFGSEDLVVWGFGRKISRSPNPKSEIQLSLLIGTTPFLSPALRQLAGSLRRAAADCRRAAALSARTFPATAFPSS